MVGAAQTTRLTYFAYGSNLDPSQIAARCPGHEVIGPALLEDFRLCFPRRSPVRNCAVASIAAHKGQHVWGVAYLLCDEDATALHGYEGYDPFLTEGENRYVIRQVRVVQPETSKNLNAFTYVAVPTANPGRPSSDYLDHIKRGAAHHSLPQAWLDHLFSLDHD